MYVGFFASPGLLASSHYILDWSFKGNRESQALDLASFPGPKKKQTALNIRIRVDVVWCGVQFNFMANGSIEKFLFDEPKTVLNWKQRIKIMKGLASVLFYSHAGFDQVVIQRQTCLDSLPFFYIQK